MPYLIEPSHQFVSWRAVFSRCSVESTTYAGAMTSEARRD
jgi:hypothetical protein